MNYYDEILQKIDELMDSKDYEQAKRIILNELDIAYVPRDFEEKLNDYLAKINTKTFKVKQVSDEDIETFLFEDQSHQLIAVDELNKRNLRDFDELVDKYLKEGSFKNAKVLLIDSLIRQSIDKEYTFIDGDSSITFNPSKLVCPEECKAYKKGQEVLSDYYLKEPSKLKMAMDLLFKEIMMSLPNNLDDKDGELIANKIIEFINKAFE